MSEHSQSRVAVSGCEVSVKRGGQGAPLLYLHGAGGAAIWLPFMADLAASHDVIVPEHPGFGASQMPDWLDDIHDAAYFYLDFMAQLELDDVHLVGSSIGGWIAAEIAVRNTSRIKTLTLSAPAGIRVVGLRRGDPFLWSPEDTMRNLVADAAVADKLLAHTPSQAELDIQIRNRETLARLAWAPRLHDPSLPKWLHRIDVPTQIVWGEEDRLFPVAYAEAFKDLIPGAKVTTFPGCGHLPQIERKDDFVGAITGFIREAGA